MADDTLPASGRITTNATSLKTEDVDKVFRLSPMGQITTAIGDNIRGINHRQAPSLIQINKDRYGLTFFTRPRLNLSSENIRVIRKLAPLLSTREDSTQRIIRCLLDPKGNKTGLFTSPWVDAEMPFIPLLTNSLISLPGWPDLAMPYSTSHEGVRKEQFNLADGSEEIYRSIDLTANFRNMQGDMITPMFEYWLTYMRAVYLGEIIPHPEMILNNEVDYQTRIYRLVLDSTKTFVLRIAATGVGMPVSAPIGAAFNYEADTGSGPVNDGLQQVSVHFANSGIMYNDDILAYEFNLASEQWFNPAMAEKSRASTFQKVAFDELAVFNYRGYPRINLATYELEWYVRKTEYAQVLPLVQQYKSNQGK